MRFESIFALSGVAAAMEVPEGNPYLAQFNGIVSNFGARLPYVSTHNAAAAEEAKMGDMKMSYITLENWKEILYEPVQEDATEPEEWWMLVTGRNNTCWGKCLQVEAAWNESATILAQRENPPHMATLNCDDQPVLCNSWSAGTGILWVFDMLPPPADIDIHIKRLNFTTTTADDIVALYDSGKDKLKLHEGAFHPFHGWIANYQLALPFGFVLWAFNVLPTWTFMLLMSFASRSLMNRTAAPKPKSSGAGAARPAPTIK